MLGPGFEGRGNGNFGGMYQIKHDDHIWWFSSLRLGMPRMDVSSRSPDFPILSDYREGKIWSQPVGDLRGEEGEFPGAPVSSLSQPLLFSPLTMPCINSSRPLLCLVSHPVFLPEGFLHGGCLVSRSGLCFQTTFQHLWEWRHGKSDVRSSSVGTRRWQELRHPVSWLHRGGCWGRPHLSAVFFL